MEGKLVTDRWRARSRRHVFDDRCHTYDPTAHPDRCSHPPCRCRPVRRQADLATPSPA